MAGHLRALFAAAAGTMGLVAAGGAHAACNTCVVAPTPCNCVPTTHQVTIPGVVITPPTITVINTTATATASASATAVAGASSVSTTGLNQVIYSTGGGSSYYIGEGNTGEIPQLHVEEGRRICTKMQEFAKMAAIEATCLDDKNVPHPASQVSPDRDIGEGYEGEVYRCIAGTHMQYTIGEYASAADFSHGQTISCVKGEALYHSASGQLACRPQKPARDCNERSLLRRYGAGIKVLKMMAAQQCVAWKSQTVAAGAAASETMVLDGGVGH
jgi:hypothetical protein